MLIDGIQLLQFPFSLFPTNKMKCDGEFDINLQEWEESNERSDL